MTRFNAGRLLDAGEIRLTAERSPRLRAFLRTVAEHSEAGDRRAGALLEHVIRRIVDDVGDLHLTNALTRLSRIEALRDNIAGILDHVLDGGELPPGVSPETLGQYFDELSTEMRELSRPREQIVGDEPLRLHDDSTAYAESLLREFEGSPGGTGAHLEPTGALADAFRTLPDGQRSALRRAAELQPRELWQVISAETESGSHAAFEELRTRLAGRLSEAELAELTRAMAELARARNRALQISPARLAEALARIDDPQLRLAVEAGGDVWIVQQVAIHNPEALAHLWETFRANGGDATDAAGFRAHLRDYMTHWGRASVGEYTAAFSLSSIETFLKGPDANPQIAGTDLVGIGHDGWGWLIDDKSHRAPRVSGVTAFTDHLARNLFDDARRFEDAIHELRQRDPAFAADPRVLDIIQRMREAATEIERIQRTGRVAGRPARIAAALDQFRLRLRVTSAAGEVRDISAALRALGIGVEPAGFPLTLPRRPGGIGGGG